jgi:hypothetical protein
MSEVVWAKLLLRAVGLLLIGLSGPNIVGTIGMAISSWDQFSTWNAEHVGGYIVSSLGTVMQFAFGVYLLVGGLFVTRLCLRGLDHYCLSCGYDVSTISSAVCPECGATLPVRKGVAAPSQSGPGATP